MANYDYRVGRKRIEEILDNPLTTMEDEKFPLKAERTFDTNQQSWVSVVLVDLRLNASLFATENNEKASKVMRSFTSEIVEILKDDANLIEVGTFGKFVYAVYSTPNQEDVYECVKKAFCVNTCINMLNKLFQKKDYPILTAGIGVGMANELLAKAGYKEAERSGVSKENSKENSKDNSKDNSKSEASIGEAMTKAINLASLANDNRVGAVILSKITYVNVLNKLKEDNSGKNLEGMFAEYNDPKLGTFYHADIVQSDFNEWIEQGMKK